VILGSRDIVVACDSCRRRCRGVPCGPVHAEQCATPPNRCVKSRRSLRRWMRTKIDGQNDACMKIWGWYRCTYRPERRATLHWYVRLDSLQWDAALGDAIQWQPLLLLLRLRTREIADIGTRDADDEQAIMLEKEVCVRRWLSGWAPSTIGIRLALQPANRCRWLITIVAWDGMQRQRQVWLPMRLVNRPTNWLRLTLNILHKKQIVSRIC